MMAVGAFTAAAIIAVLYRDQGWLLLLAVGMMIGIGGPTVPPVFRRLVKLLGVKKVNPDIDRALAGLDYRLMLFGWLVNLVGWALMGLSLWLTLRAVPTITAVPVELHHLPRVTCCVALALVAGFLSMVPGGIVVREYVVMALLSGPFGVGPPPCVPSCRGWSGCWPSCCLGRCCTRSSRAGMHTAARGSAA